MKLALSFTICCWILRGQELSDDYDSLLEEVSEATEALRDVRLNTAPVISLDHVAVPRQGTMAATPRVNLFRSPTAAMHGSVRDMLGEKASTVVTLPQQVPQTLHRLQIGWRLTMQKLAYPVIMNLLRQ